MTQDWGQEGKIDVGEMSERADMAADFMGEGVYWTNGAAGGEGEGDFCQKW